MIWKARYIACSNCQAWRLCEALWISEARNLARFECYQLQYSLVVRDIEQELVPLCLHKGLGIVAWGPLASGWRLDGDVLVRLNKVSHLP